MVEGLAGGRTALVAKMHHALVDGLAAVDVSTVILDPTPRSSTSAAARAAAEPEAPPARRGLDQLTRIASAQLTLPRKLAREAVTRTMSPTRAPTPRQVRDAAGVVRRAGARPAARRPTRA